MPKSLKYFLIGSVVLIFTIITFAAFQSNQTTYTDIEEYEDELNYYQKPSNDKDKINEEDDKNYKGLSHVDESFIHEIYEKNRNPVYIGQLFVNVLQRHDIDLFSQLFHPQVFNDFIGRIDADKRANAVETIMNELSKNQTISQYQIKQKKGTYGEEYSELDITIFYEDNSKLILDGITLILESHHHGGENDHGIYSIAISPMDLKEIMLDD